MKCFNLILLTVLLFSFTAFSQQKTTEHIVSKGETISKIATKYNVTVKAIYELNPEAKKGIKFNSKLLIPVSTAHISTVVFHEVSAKETLYGISKEYGLTVDDLYKSNPALEEEGLKIGQKISIVGATKSIQSNSKKPLLKLASDTISENKIMEGIEYEVLSKQTKYNIAKEHGINVTMLDKANPILQTEELKAGQKIIIPVKKYIPNQDQQSKGNDIPVFSKENSAKVNVFSDSVEVGTTSKEANGITHEVLPKETKYSIAKQYGITIAELDKANLFLESERLKIGQKIIIPVTSFISSSQEKQNTEVYKDLNNAALSKLTVSNKIEEIAVTHKVLPKETKYGIAKEFGVTVKELERQNPKIVNKFTIGMVLNISSAKNQKTTAEVNKDVVETTEAEIATVKPIYGSDFIEQLIFSASENIGTRYRSGGTTKDGFDCSGLMCTTFGAFDIQLPRTSLEQSQYGVVLDIDNAKKGDLIFFKTRGKGQINHVGMVVEVGDGDVKFIHASNSGVIISSIKESYYSKRVVQVNRVL